MKFFSVALMVIGLAAPPYQSLPRPLAYLDPGSGSFILQLLVAALFGALFLVKVYWGKIKTFFQSHFSKQVKEPSDDK